MGEKEKWKRLTKGEEYDNGKIVMQQCDRGGRTRGQDLIKAKMKEKRTR